MLAHRLLTAPWHTFCDVVEHLDETSREVALYERCRVDRLAFFAVFLPDVFEFPFSAMHLELLSEPKLPWQERPRPQRDVIAAPRGGAKSTLLAYADLVHDVCYGFECFVCVASTTHSLSEKLVKDLFELFSDRDSNPLLHDTYGPFRVKGTQTDFRVMCPGHPWKYGVTFRAFSMKSRPRGHTAPGRKRPSKWILDDIVDPHTVGNPLIRDATETFLDDDVGESGFYYTQYTILGTRLDVDDVVSRKLLGDPRWRGRMYQALPRFPDERDGLWEEARQIWADLEVGPARVREAAARAFYEERREAMDAGAVVGWPDNPQEDLFACMLRFWSNPAGFFREKQNDPSRAADQVFDVQNFRRCRWSRRDKVITTAAERLVPLSACDTAIWWDPIRYGKNARKRDRAAFAVVARERRTGRRFVLELHLVDGPTSMQRAKLWELFARFGNSRVSYHYENNIGQLHLEEDFQRERKMKRNGRGLVLKEHNSQKSKNDRIIRIEPDCTNGFVEFATDLQEAVTDQFRQFPGGTHDDAPDAIERADWVLTGTGAVAFGR